MKKSKKLTIPQLLNLADDGREVFKRKESYYDLLNSELRYVVLGAKAWRKFFNEFGEGSIEFTKYDWGYPNIAAKMSSDSDFLDGYESFNEAIIYADFFDEHLNDSNEIIFIFDDCVIREKFSKKGFQCSKK